MDGPLTMKMMMTMMMMMMYNDPPFYFHGTLVSEVVDICQCGDRLFPAIVSHKGIGNGGNEMA